MSDRIRTGCWDALESINNLRAGLAKILEPTSKDIIKFQVMDGTQDIVSNSGANSFVFNHIMFRKPYLIS